jgi:hypothetical protein
MVLAMGTHEQSRWRVGNFHLEAKLSSLELLTVENLPGDYLCRSQLPQFTEIVKSGTKTRYYPASAQWTDAGDGACCIDFKRQLASAMSDLDGIRASKQGNSLAARYTLRKLTILFKRLADSAAVRFSTSRIGLKQRNVRAADLMVECKFLNSRRFQAQSMHTKAEKVS